MVVAISLVFSVTVFASDVYKTCSDGDHVLDGFNYVYKEYENERIVFSAGTLHPLYCSRAYLDVTIYMNGSFWYDTSISEYSESALFIEHYYRPELVDYVHMIAFHEAYYQYCNDFLLEGMASESWYN